MNGGGGHGPGGELALNRVAGLGRDICVAGNALGHAQGFVVARIAQVGRANKPCAVVAEFEREGVSASGSTSTKG